MARIPAEIVGLIVAAICEDAESDSIPGIPPDKVRRRRLSACSLTCRYWATRFRPHLFQKITIRSQDDASLFLSFVKCALVGWDPNVDGSMNIAPHVWWLSVSLAQAQEQPWIHHVLMNRHLLPALSSVYMTLRGTESSPTLNAPLLPLYDHLPRSLPRSITRCDTMIMSDVHTAHFKDLLQIVGKTSCWALECYGLRCNEIGEDSDVPVELHSKSRFLVRKVIASRCRDVPMWPFLWLMFTTRLPQNTALRRKPANGCVPYMAADDLRKLQGFVRCATEIHSTSHEADEYGDGHTIERRFQPFSAAYVLGLMSARVVIGLSFPPSNMMKIHGKWHTRQQVGEHPWKILMDMSSAGFVTKIVVGVDVQRPEDRRVSVPIISDDNAVMCLPWTALDEHASRFGDDMASFEIVVYTDTVRMRQFAIAIAQLMPRMSQARKLRFWHRWEEGKPVDGFIDIDFQWDRSLLNDED